MERVIVSWSGGKDSALALYEILKNKNFEVLALLTTLAEDYNRVSMHGIRCALLENQAHSLKLPLEKVFLSKESPQEEYESAMQRTLEKYKNAGVSFVVFGDIFLEDLRRYREKNLDKIGMGAIFPMWKKDSRLLARGFIKSGFKAVVISVDGNALDKKFIGRDFDENFLSDLPDNIDPSGENGEFHSFVYDGPIFKRKIEFQKGDIVFRDNRFYYCDLIPI